MAVLSILSPDCMHSQVGRTYDTVDEISRAIFSVTRRSSWVVGDKMYRILTLASIQMNGIGTSKEYPKDSNPYVLASDIYGGPKGLRQVPQCVAGGEARAGGGKTRTKRQVRSQAN